MREKLKTNMHVSFFKMLQKWFYFAKDCLIVRKIINSTSELLLRQSYTADGATAFNCWVYSHELHEMKVKNGWMNVVFQVFIKTFITSVTRKLSTANRSRVSARDRPCKKFSWPPVWSPCKIWFPFTFFFCSFSCVTLCTVDLTRICCFVIVNIPSVHT